MIRSSELKCVVWDLDGTVWDGVAVELLAGERLQPRADVLAAMRRLAAAGVVNSIVSRTDPSVEALLREHTELWEMVVYPQLGWGPKSRALERLSEQLGVAVGALALVDDSPFERAEVAALLPDVAVLDRAGLLDWLHGGALSADQATEDARQRTRRYQQEARRRQAAAGAPSTEEFLASCRMTLTVRPAQPGDSARVVELLRRTHRLNSTGVVSSPEDWLAWPQARSWVLLAELDDVFGDYGTVAAALLRDDGAGRLVVHNLAVSCRVAGRGVAAAFLHEVAAWAYSDGATELVAPVRDTGVNVELRVLLRRLGFVTHPEGAVLQGHLHLTDHLAAPSPWLRIANRLGSVTAPRPPQAAGAAGAPSELAAGAPRAASVRVDVDRLVARAVGQAPSLVTTLPDDTDLFGPPIGLESRTGAALLADIDRSLGVDIAGQDLELAALSSLGALRSYVERNRPAVAMKLTPERPASPRG